jgi:hypothetical protein
MYRGKAGIDIVKKKHRDTVLLLSADLHRLENSEQA